MSKTYEEFVSDIEYNGEQHYVAKWLYIRRDKLIGETIKKLLNE